MTTNSVVEKESKPQKTKAVLAALQERYPAPEWASFVELRTGTGTSFERTLDFFTINVYPSKGFLRVAFEVKVSRSDFVNELENPTKREPAEALANECFFVTPLNLLHADEVPEGWGLMELTAGGLKAKKRAQQRKVEDCPISFFASVARRASDKKESTPAGVWFYEGREIPFEALQKMASDEVRKESERIARHARMEGAEEERNSSYAKRCQMVYQLVDRAIGRDVANDEEKLWAFLNGQATPHLSEAQRRELINAKDKIEKILREIR